MRVRRRSVLQSLGGLKVVMRAPRLDSRERLARSAAADAAVGSRSAAGASVLDGIEPRTAVAAITMCVAVVERDALACLLLEDRQT